MARPARALGLLPQQLLHQVVEGVVGAQVPKGRAVLAHRAGGRYLHLPAASHAPAAEVVAAAQSHGVAEGVVADGTEQLLLEGAGRPGGHSGTQFHCHGQWTPNPQLSLQPLPPACRLRDPAVNGARPLPFGALSDSGVVQSRGARSEGSAPIPI